MFKPLCAPEVMEKQFTAGTSPAVSLVSLGYMISCACCECASYVQHHDNALSEACVRQSLVCLHEAWRAARAQSPAWPRPLQSTFSI